MKKGYIILIILLACISCTQDAKWEVAEFYMAETISILTPTTAQVTLHVDTLAKPMVEAIEMNYAPESDRINSKTVLLTNETNFTVVLADLITDQQYYVSYNVIPSYLQQKEYTSSFVAHCNALPEVVTGVADNLTPTSAQLNGIVRKGISDYTITEYGFYYSLLQTGEYERHKVQCGENSDGCSFNAKIDTLRAGATYYYYAYATNCNGIVYGDTLTFTLPKTY